MTLVTIKFSWVQPRTGLQVSLLKKRKSYINQKQVINFQMIPSPTGKSACFFKSHRKIRILLILTSQFKPSDLNGHLKILGKMLEIDLVNFLRYHAQKDGLAQEVLSSNSNEIGHSTNYTDFTVTYSSVVENGCIQNRAKTLHWVRNIKNTYSFINVS